MAVAYLRVSTNRQGRSGLGLEAQREAVLAYLADRAMRITAEFVEVESGRNSDRPALAQALASARLHRAPLVVASVSRLTRSLGFLTRLLEAGADVRFCDLPQIEGPTGRFMLQQMAAVAELEAGMISARTKAARQAAQGSRDSAGWLPWRLTQRRSRCPRLSNDTGGTHGWPILHRSLPSCGPEDVGRRG